MRTIVFALKEAYCKGFSRTFFYVKEVIDSINGKEDWAVNPIILDMKNQCSGFSLVRFFFVSKTLNEVAHVSPEYCSRLSKEIL